MNTHTHRGRRLLAVVGAIALGAAGVIGLHSAAQAVTPAPPGTGNVNQDVAQKSIIIHKHKAVDGTTTLNPSAPPSADSGIGGAIDGATFNAWAIDGINLTTPDGWDRLSRVQLAGSGACDITSSDDGVSLGAALGEQDTAGGGIATFKPRSIGAFLVCETKLPPNASMGSSPFIVTVPTPYKGDWLYDVHVFPKNTINAVDKQIEAPDGFEIGSTVSFNVSTDISPLPEGKAYTSFIITDTLDDRLGEVKVASVTLGGETLTEGVGDADGYTVVTGPGNKLTVSIKPSLLNDPTVFGKELVVLFSGKVLSLGDEGQVDNTAYLFVNNPNMEGDGLPSRTSESKWGDLTIRKVDAKNESALLSGAKFKIHHAKYPYADECATEVIDLEHPIKRFGKDEFETGVSGEVMVGGLYITSDREDGHTDAKHRCYVIEETQAPAGYVTPTGTAALKVVKLLPGDAVAADVTVPNTQQTGPNLPLTGAVGQAALILGGLTLAGGGITAAVLRRRKTSA